MWKQIRMPLAVAGTASAAIAAAIAAGPQPVARPAAEPAHRVVADGLAALPSDSLTDWTSYSDYVVDAVVTKVTRAEPTAEETRSGKGLAVRYVTLAISRVLWSAPHAHARPGTLVLPDGGWLLEAGRPEREVMAGDAARLEAGHHYLMPIFYDETFHPAWQGLAPQAFLPFDDGVAGRGMPIYGDDLKQVDAARDPHQSRRALWGKDTTGIETALAAAKPDARAQANAGLPPSARYQAAIRR
jgi:hypothetical protein